MVHFIKMLMQNLAWRLGSSFSLLIGRQEREVPDVAGDEVARLSFVTS